MDLSELSMNLLCQTPAREIVKVSTVYPDRVTAQVVYPIPGRTTVRTYTAEQVATWREPTKGLLGRHDSAWGFATPTV